MTNPSLLTSGLMTPDTSASVGFTLAGYPSNVFTTTRQLVFPASPKRVLIICTRSDGLISYASSGSPGLNFSQPALEILTYTASSGAVPFMRPLAQHRLPQVWIHWIAIPDDDTGGILVFDRVGAWQLWRDCDQEQPFQTTNAYVVAGGSYTPGIGAVQPQYTTLIHARIDPVGLPVAIFAVGGDAQSGPQDGTVTTTVGSDINPNPVDLAPAPAGSGIIDLGDITSLGRARVSIATSPLLPEIKLITHYVASAWMLTKADGYRSSWQLYPGTCGTPLSLFVYPYEMSTPDRGDIGPSHTFGLTLRPDGTHAQSPWVTVGWFRNGEIGAGYCGTPTFPIGAADQPFTSIEFDNTSWPQPNTGFGTLYTGPEPWVLPTQMNEDAAAFVEIVGGGNFAVARDSSGSVWTCGIDASAVDADIQFFGATPSPAASFGTLAQGKNWPAYISEIWLSTGIADATQLSAGTNHAVALRGTQSPLLWGSNQWGQLGAGVATQPTFVYPGLTGSGYPTPVSPVGLGTAQIVQASCGWQYTLLVDSLGAVYGSGNNSIGQLGTGDLVNRNTFVLIPGLPPIVEIAAGSVTSFARTADGRIFATGAYRTSDGWGLDLSALDPAGVGWITSWVQIWSGGAKQIRCYQQSLWFLNSDNTAWRWQFRNVPAAWQQYDPTPFAFLSLQNTSTANVPLVGATIDGRLLRIGIVPPLGSVIANPPPTEFTPPLKGGYAAATSENVLYMLTGVVTVPKKSKPFVTCQSIGPF